MSAASAILASTRHPSHAPTQAPVALMKRDAAAAGFLQGGVLYAIIATAAVLVFGCGGLAAYFRYSKIRAKKEAVHVEGHAEAELKFINASYPNSKWITM